MMKITRKIALLARSPRSKVILMYLVVKMVAQATALSALLATRGVTERIWQSTQISSNLATKAPSRFCEE